MLGIQTGCHRLYLLDRLPLLTTTRGRNEKLWHDPPFMDNNDGRKREEATTSTVTAEYSYDKPPPGDDSPCNDFSPHGVWLNILRSEHGKIRKRLDLPCHLRMEDLSLLWAFPAASKLRKFSSNGFKSAHILAHIVTHKRYNSPKNCISSSENLYNVVIVEYMRY
jgi:hypothetical protein